jgi:hypothetical protein
MVWADKGSTLYVMREGGEILAVDGAKRHVVATAAAKEELCGAEAGGLFLWDREERELSWLDLEWKSKRHLFYTDPFVTRVEWVSKSRRLIVYRKRFELKPDHDYDGRWWTVECQNFDGDILYRYDDAMPGIWSVDYNPVIRMLLVCRTNIAGQTAEWGTVEIDVARRRTMFDPLPLQANGIRAYVTIHPPTPIRFVGKSLILRFLITGDEHFWSRFRPDYVGNTFPPNTDPPGTPEYKGSRLEFWLCTLDGTPWAPAYTIPESDTPDEVAVSPDGHWIAAYMKGVIHILHLRSDFKLPVY